MAKAVLITADCAVVPALAVMEADCHAGSIPYTADTEKFTAGTPVAVAVKVYAVPTAPDAVNGADAHQSRWSLP